MNEKKPGLKQIKQRHHLIICGPCISAVRVLLRSQVLCRDYLSLCSENWRTLCSYEVQWKKRTEGGGVQKEKSKHPLPNGNNDHNKNKTKL